MFAWRDLGKWKETWRMMSKMPGWQDDLKLPEIDRVLYAFLQRLRNNLVRSRCCLKSLSAAVVIDFPAVSASVGSDASARSCEKACHSANPRFFACTDINNEPDD